MLSKLVLVWVPVFSSRVLSFATSREKPALLETFCVLASFTDVGDWSLRLRSFLTTSGTSGFGEASAVIDAALRLARACSVTFPSRTLRLKTTESVTEGDARETSALGRARSWSLQLTLPSDAAAVAGASPRILVAECGLFNDGAATLAGFSFAFSFLLLRRLDDADGRTEAEQMPTSRVLVTLSIRPIVA